MSDDPADKLASPDGAPRTELTEADAELPVVARIVVEVRSNGTRTLARGAMEDAASQTRVAIEAAGGTPWELALALARSIATAPWLPRGVALTSLRGLLKKKP